MKRTLQKTVPTNTIRAFDVDLIGTICYRKRCNVSFEFRRNGMCVTLTNDKHSVPTELKSVNEPFFYKHIVPTELKSVNDNAFL